jgi:hypothetical protein
MGPPLGWIGGHVGQRLLLARTSDVWMALSEFEVFPTGVLFAIVAKFRPDPTDSTDLRQRPLMDLYGGADGPASECSSPTAASSPWAQARSGPLAAPTHLGRC